jgi:hypothetical protein
MRVLFFRKVYTATFALIFLISSNLTFAHTNSIGFQSSSSSAASCSVGSGSTCVNIEVFMGTYHNNSPAEGHAALFLQNGDGTENQVLGQSAPGGTRINFSLTHSLLSELPNFDGSNYWDSSSEAFTKLATEFDLGTNYYFADGSNKALNAGPTNPNLNWGSFPFIYGHQSAVFSDVGAGIYRLDYDTGSPDGKADLSFDWYALPGISEAFFRVQNDGTVSIVMNPERFYEFASFSNVASVDNAAKALDGVRPTIRTTSTNVGAFFEELYKMPLSSFYETMKVISGDIHGQVNKKILGDLADNSNDNLNQLVRNQDNDNIWVFVDETSSSSPKTSKNIGNSVDGSGVVVGKNWQGENENFFGVSLSFDEKKLSSISGQSEISTSASNIYYGKQFDNFEVNTLASLSNSNIETTRTVNLESTSNTHLSEYDYLSFATRTEIAKRFRLDKKVELKSSVGLSYQLTKAEKFEESGSNLTKLQGAQEKLDQQQLSIRQELTIQDNYLGYENRFHFIAGAHKQLMNSVGGEGRTLSMHDSNWEVGIPFDEQLILETEAIMNIRLNSLLELNAGVKKLLSSSNSNKINFSLSGAF